MSRPRPGQSRGKLQIPRFARDDKFYKSCGLRDFAVFLWGRFLTGITNFNPDQTSVTAQTFISTSPASNPLWRITSSVRSVTTPEVFFGHAIHSIPAGASAFAAGHSSSSSPLPRLGKEEDEIEIVNAGCSQTLDAAFANSPRSSVFTSSGTCSRAMRKSSLMPNFFASGVPEYPGINRSDVSE